MATLSAYTAAQIEAVLGIKKGTLRQWAHRGHVKKVSRNLYDGDSVIARWRQQEGVDAAPEQSELTGTT